jgi:hypothetical protein
MLHKSGVRSMFNVENKFGETKFGKTRFGEMRVEWRLGDPRFGKLIFGETRFGEMKVSEMRFGESKHAPEINLQLLGWPYWNKTADNMNFFASSCSPAISRKSPKIIKISLRIRKWQAKIQPGVKPPSGKP